MVKPHGGELINKITPAKLRELENLQVLVLSREQAKDVRNIAHGVYSPLTGFLRKEDFDLVVSNMRLADGTLWPIPIVLDINGSTKDRLDTRKVSLLVDETGNPFALMDNLEIYRPNKEKLAEGVYGTTDLAHPGVVSVKKMGKFFVSGDIWLIDEKNDYFDQHNLTPNKARRRFENLGWKSVVAFQTRNVPHRGHEFLQKEALKQTDGLFIQPVIGEKKLQDFKDEYIVTAYKILIERYFPRGKALLGILPLRMRYAGPREAVFHAIIRQNFGCSHFIIGRDHAGVGDFYEPFAAQEIFENFHKENLAIQILRFPEVVYSSRTQKHHFKEEVEPENRVRFSGTKVRQMIKNKQKPPEYLMRPEVYNLLTNSYNALVDESYKIQPHNKNGGFVLWFTGLSQSGKSTTADMVYEKLLERGMRVERLDGDVVRDVLTKDLGFTKEDRDENIRRVGFVAELLSQNNVAVVASFISPYQKQRDELREKIEDFIEVHVSTPLEVCEARDSKGLYAKARAGEIKNFTGIDDPYEEPGDPHLVIEPHNHSVEECAEKVINYLKKEALL